MKELTTTHKKLLSILIGAMTLAAIVICSVFYIYNHQKTIPAPTALEGQVVTEVPILQKVETFSSQEAFDKAHPEFKGILLIATSTSQTL